MTPEDAAATRTLLRAPAAIAAGAFLAGSIAGEAAAWDRRPPGSLGSTILRIAVIALVCLPFLLPSDWFRSHRKGMLAWIKIAAIAACVRGAFLWGSLYPIQSLAAWLSFAVLEAAIGAILWLAVLAIGKETLADG